MDKEKHLQDYVRLSFNATHPMLYVCREEHRIYNPVILRINPLVCSWKHTKFSDSNANKRGAKFGPSIDDLKKINLKYATTEGFVSRDDIERHKFKQAEVMVLKHIPLKFINNIDDFR
jgi:diaminopimelate decarboxylase